MTSWMTVPGERLALSNQLTPCCGRGTGHGFQSTVGSATTSNPAGHSENFDCIRLLYNIDGFISRHCLFMFGTLIFPQLNISARATAAASRQTCAKTPGLYEQTGFKEQIKPRAVETQKLMNR